MEPSDEAYDIDAQLEEGEGKQSHFLLSCLFAAYLGHQHLNLTVCVCASHSICQCMAVEMLAPVF